MLESRSSIQVRFSETDAMGIAYHGSYLPWLEIGRTKLLKDYGLNYRALIEAGYHIPVLEIALQYRRPARYDDEITIETTIREKPGVRIKIEYRVLRDTDLLATGSSQHAFIDHSGLPTRPPADFTATMAKLFGGTV